MLNKATTATTPKCAPAPAKPLCKPAHIKERIAFAKLDRDHDRAVSRDEYLGTSTGIDRLLKEKAFQAADRNHDGKLSFLEFVLKGRPQLHGHIHGHFHGLLHGHLHAGLAACRAWLK